MSRLAKKPILIPEKVEASKEGGILKIKGPLGELKRNFSAEIEIVIEEKKIILHLPRNLKKSAALWGTYASHIKNMIEGVTKGFEKKLILEGIGYRVQLEGKKIILGLGLSQPIKLEIPEGIKVQIEKNIIKISGTDKEMVGQFSADIRALKKPEPYKGKGIRYEDEIIRRKAGKKAVTTAQ